MALENNKELKNIKNIKKDPLDWVNDTEKGTFYRKFTNTRILNMIN